MPTITNATYAPVVINVENGESVHQRVLLIYGRAGPQNVEFESNITVEQHASNFPSTTWQVFNSHFKCLVHLDPGLNDIKFILDTEPFSSGSQPLTTTFQVNYIPLLQNPPLHLAILVAKDSKEIIDVPDEKEDSHECTLEAVKAKLRCAGYLWQAFTAEQMNRSGFGRRVFRLNEEWIEDTLSNQNPKLRQTAKIHIIRSSYTLEEILDPEIAQQNPNLNEDKKDLYAMFMEGLAEYGAPFDSQCYVAGLVLDSHYDPSPEIKFIRGHAALGGGSGNVRLGIFGSHLTHAWPKHIEEVVSCFQEDTAIDENKLANDAGECGTMLKCCNIGIGAFLHEVGHALGCPHTPGGIMSRGFNDLNRTFTVKEPNNPSPITPSDENGAYWHRCDVIRFRYHPCFRLPSDQPTSIIHNNIGADFLVMDGSLLLIKSPSGVALIEFYTGENIVAYVDYVENNQTEVTLDIPEIIENHGDNNSIIKLNVVAKNLVETCVENLQKLCEESKMTLPVHGEVCKSPPLGKLDNSATEFKVLFNKFIEGNRCVTLRKMVIKHGYYIDAVTFFWSDDSKLRIGTDEQGDEEEFIFEEGEKIVEIKVNCGWYIDGFEIKTNLGRSSEWFGGNGGDDHGLNVPNDEFEIIGLYGSSGDYLNTLGVIYKRTT